MLVIGWLQMRQPADYIGLFGCHSHALQPFSFIFFDKAPSSCYDDDDACYSCCYYYYYYYYYYCYSYCYTTTTTTTTTTATTTTISTTINTATATTTVTRRWRLLLSNSVLKMSPPTYGPKLGKRSKAPPARSRRGSWWCPRQSKLGFPRWITLTVSWTRIPIRRADSWSPLPVCKRSAARNPDPPSFFRFYIGFHFHPQEGLGFFWVGMVGSQASGNRLNRFQNPSALLRS